MFEKEKVIDGVLNYRENPEDDFKPYTSQELTDKNRLLGNENSDLWLENEKIRELSENFLGKINELLGN